MLRCFDAVADDPLVRLISLMDHSPGVGQYANLEFYRNLRRRGGLDEETVDRRIAELQEQRTRVREPNRRTLLDRVRGKGIALASHDDRTVEEVAENARDGIRISEFPVTMAAAEAAKQAGMDVIAARRTWYKAARTRATSRRRICCGPAGSTCSRPITYPGIDRGRVSLRARGTGGVARRHRDDHVARGGSGGPARPRTTDPGSRADLVRVRVHDTLPVVRQVWSGGERVI